MSRPRRGIGRGIAPPPPPRNTDEEAAENLAIWEAGVGQANPLPEPLPRQAVTPAAPQQQVPPPPSRPVTLGRGVRPRPTTLNLASVALPSVPSPSSPRTPGRQLAMAALTASPRSVQAPIAAYLEHLPQHEKIHILDQIGARIQTCLDRGLGIAFVAGPTGSGKSLYCGTAILKLYLPFLPEFKRKIILCEPRRVAAAGLFDRLKVIGSSVNLPSSLFGLKMKDRSVNAQNSKYVVATAGYLLTQLQHNPEKIYDYHTIILDEIHEMEMDIELLIGMICTAQFSHYKKYKMFPTSTAISYKDPHRFPYIIMMSATMRAEEFYNHFRQGEFFTTFSKKLRPQLEEITFNMENGTNSAFRTREMNLSDLETIGIDCEDAINEIKGITQTATGVRIRPSPPKLHRSVIMTMFSVIDKIYTLGHFARYRDGLILMNIPGLVEIEECINYYEQNKDQIIRPLRLIPFHAHLSHEELMDAKRQASDFSSNVVNVLLATTIADSSLTLPRCSVVLDSCLIKKPHIHLETRMNILRKEWANWVVRMQRKGRTGRVCHGFYCAFVPHDFHRDDTTSDLIRKNIDDVFIRSLTLAQLKFPVGIEGIVTRFFTEFLMSRPLDSHIQSSVMGLLNEGMIIRKTLPRNSAHYLDGYQLTVAGMASSQIQANANLSRTCIVATALGGFQAIAYIAAQTMIDRGQLMKSSTASLRCLHFVQSFMMSFSSDALAHAAIFRVWLKCPGTSRTDGKPKLSMTETAELSPNTTARCNDDFLHCNLPFLCAVDDNYMSLHQELQEQGVKIRTNLLYVQAGKDDMKQKEAATATLQIQLFSLLVTTPIQQQFYSQPGIHHERIDSLSDVCHLHSVILRPAPPLNADIREWGVQLMHILAYPRNILPSIRVDRENNVVIATWVPYSQDYYLGMIGLSVSDCLIRGEFGGKDSRYSSLYYTFNEGSEATSSKKEVLSALEKLSISSKSEKVQKRASDSFRDKQYFAIRNFIDPHHIGCTTAKDEPKYLEKIETLLSKRSQFVPLTLEDVRIGQEVIYTDPKKEAKTSKWQEKCSRSIVMAGLSDDNLQGLSDHAQQNLQILINVIDVGYTFYVPLSTLSLFEPGTCDYGMPDLFTFMAPRGWRVMLSSLQPLLGEKWTWSPDKRAKMVAPINDLKFYGGIVTLDIEYINDRDRIIVARDAISKASGRSLYDYCITNKLASKLEGLMLADKEHEEGPDFLPAIRRVDSYLAYAEANNKLRALGERFEKGVARFDFESVFSMIEVDFITVIKKTAQQMSLKPSRDSVNCRFLDHRLAVLPFRTKEYDPLLAVGLDCRIQEYSDGHLSIINMISPITTVSNAWFGTVPLVQLLVYPVVEMIWIEKEADKKEAIAIRLYSKNEEDGFDLTTKVDCKVNIDFDDVDIIEAIRGELNAIHTDVKYRSVFERVTPLVIKLLQRERPKVVFEVPQRARELGPIPKISSIGDNFLRQKIIFTTYEPPIPRAQNDDENWEEDPAAAELAMD